MNEKINPHEIISDLYKRWKDSVRGIYDEDTNAKIDHIIELADSWMDMYDQIIEYKTKRDIASVTNKKLSVGLEERIEENCNYMKYTFDEMKATADEIANEEARKEVCLLLDIFSTRDKICSRNNNEIIDVTGIDPSKTKSIEREMLEMYNYIN